GALREDQARIVALVHGGNQHGRVLQRHLLHMGDRRRVHPGVAALAPAVGCDRPRLFDGAAAEFCRAVEGETHRISASSSAAGMTGNTAPPERTANISVPSTAIVSPSATMSYMTGRETSASSRPRTCR